MIYMFNVHVSMNLGTQRQSSIHLIYDNPIYVQVKSLSTFFLSFLRMLLKSRYSLSMWLYGRKHMFQA